MGTDDQSDFYEEDESAEDVWDRFERAPKTVTSKRPRDVNSLAAAIVADATEPTDATAWLVSVPSGSAIDVVVSGLGWSEPTDPYVTLDDTPSLTFA